MRHGSFTVTALAGLLAGLALLTAGCSTTYQARDTRTSGFLGDYAQLRPGADGQGQLVYVNPGTDFRRYGKIIFEPVVIMADHASSSVFTAMDEEERQAMVDCVDAMVREKLKEDYAFVSEPGPDVMRLRIAITEVEGATIVLDTVSSVVPFALALSTVRRVALDRHAGLGKAGVEMELKDALTGERLAAAVDARTGRKFTFRLDKFSRYRTFDDAFGHWTDRLRERLAQVRARTSAR